MSGLALIGYLMIFSLMVIIITKKMSAFSALILIPLVFGIIACIYNGENPFVLGSYISDGDCRYRRYLYHCTFCYYILRSYVCRRPI